MFILTKEFRATFILLSTDIDLKVAAKFFGSKFACGSSVTGEDEIVIQGDVKDDLFEVIPEKWPQVSVYETFNNSLFLKRELQLQHTSLFCCHSCHIADQQQLFSQSELLKVSVQSVKNFKYKIVLFLFLLLQIDEDSIDDLGDHKR